MPTTRNKAASPATAQVAGCPDENQLLQFLQGERAPGEGQRMEAHLDECEGCRSLVAALVRHSWASPPLSGEEPPVEWQGPGALEGESMVASSGEGIGSLLSSLASGLPVGFPLGRYQIVSRLGMGGMGVVYQAFDPELERQVAIKLVRPEIDTAAHKARLQREARAMARLSHPNIVTVYELGEFAGQLYIAMEYVEGLTLGRWIARDRPSHEAILARFREAGKGLSFAHQRGIIHRDFKPDNVLINAHQQAEVTDFGLARAASEPTASAETKGAARTEEQLLVAANEHVFATPVALAHAASGASLGRTQTGAFVGTLAYMSPEQLRGEPATAQSDQFAFCVALWESLTGQRPFEARDIQTRLEDIQAGPSAAVVSSLPSGLREVLLRGLSYDAARRYPSMDVLLAALASEPVPQRAAFSQVVAFVALAALLVLGVWWWGASPALQGHEDVSTSPNGAVPAKRAVRSVARAGSKSPALRSTRRRSSPGGRSSPTALRTAAIGRTVVKARAFSHPVSRRGVPTVARAKAPVVRRSVRASAPLLCREGSMDLPTCTEAVRISQYHLELVGAIQKGQLADAKQHFLRLQKVYMKEQK